MPDWLVVLLAIALCAAVAAAAVCGWRAARYARELDRMAHDVRACGPHGNARVTVGFRTRQTVGLARAVNALLDAGRDARSALYRERRAFQGDLAALSHDIRTPLAGAQGYLELHDLTDDPAKRAAYLASARERLATVRVLVDDLFDYTRAADADLRLRLADVRLHPVVVDALVAQYPAFAERGWKPQVDFEDEAVTVRADPEALARVMANLVVNTLHHGCDAPRIGQRGRTLEVANRVADPAAVDVGRLFERFYRADAARGGQGSGLGLAIVARLCDAMGVGVAARLEGDVLCMELRFDGGEDKGRGGGVGRRLQRPDADDGAGQ